MSYTVTVNNIDVRSTHETHFNDGKKVNRLEIINTRIKGLGFFDSPFVKSNRKIGDLFKNGVRLADVTFCLSTKSEEVEVYNLTIHIFNNEYGDKFPKIQISIFCDESLFETIRQYTRKDDAIRVQFDILEWLNEGDDTRDFETAKAKISVVETLVLGYSTKTKIDYEIEDIKDYLNRTNCAGNSVGQVADICNEFAESFRNAPASVSKNDLVGEIESLISFLRFVLQKHLNDGTAPILIRYENDDRFIFDSNAEKFNEEIEKLTNKKEKYKAIAIYNNLWTTRNAEEIFRNGLPVSSDSAQSLADNYLNLKYVYSKTCEKILLDLLIICDIFVYTSSAQFHNMISANALRSIPIGFYKFESIAITNKSGFLSKSKLASALLGSIFEVLIVGLISWGLSGLIAGNNETARVVLFGTLFAADMILIGLLHQNKIVDVSKEEHHFNIIRNMCNLLFRSSFVDVKLMRHMLNQLASSGVIFQHQLFHIISNMESRK